MVKDEFPAGGEPRRSEFSFHSGPHSEDDSEEDEDFGRFSFGRKEAGYVADDSVSEISRNLTFTSELRVLVKRPSMVSVVSGDGGDGEETTPPRQPALSRRLSSS